jgi:hypothetical protein
VFLALDFSKVSWKKELLELHASRMVRLDKSAAREVLVQIRKRFDGNHFQVRDQGGFARVHLRDEHPLESVCPGGCSHREDTAGVADPPSSDSSPMTRVLSIASWGKKPARIMTPRAIGRSYAGPSLRTAAGARLTTMR